MITSGIIRDIQEDFVCIEVYSKTEAGAPSHKGIACCGSKSGCQGSIQGSIFKAGKPKDFSIQPGERVEVELSPKKGFMELARVMILPIVLFLGGYFLVDLNFPNRETLSILGGLTGLIGCFGFNLLLAKMGFGGTKPQIVKPH